MTAIALNNAKFDLSEIFKDITGSFVDFFNVKKGIENYLIAKSLKTLDVAIEVLSSVQVDYNTDYNAETIESDLQLLKTLTNFRK